MCVCVCVCECACECVRVSESARGQDGRSDPRMGIVPESVGVGVYERD